MLRIVQGRAGKRGEERVSNEVGKSRRKEVGVTPTRVREREEEGDDLDTHATVCAHCNLSELHSQLGTLPKNILFPSSLHFRCDIGLAKC